MKVLVLSDLHTEFGKFRFPKIDYDVAVLAGDIGVGSSHRNMIEEWSKENPEKQMVMIPGNHEYYKYDLEKTNADIEGWCAKLPNVNFSDKGIYKDFIFCTLWTNFNNNNYITMWEALRWMNDYRLIRKGNLTFHPEDALKLFDEYYDYLLEHINEKSIVITHHAPSFQSIDYRRYTGDPLNGAYASNLEDLILERQPKLWIHGHIHSSNDYMIGKTRIISNPRGYVGHEINSDFNPELVVEV